MAEDVDTSQRELILEAAGLLSEYQCRAPERLLLRILVLHTHRVFCYNPSIDGVVNVMADCYRRSCREFGVKLASCIAMTRLHPTVGC